MMGLDLRVRGNDEVFFSGVGVWVDEFPRAREGTCGFPPLRD